MKKNIYKAMVFLLLVTLLAGVLAGCSNEQGGGGALEDGDETITVVDMAGRTVEIPAKVERVVTVFPPSTAMVIAIDGTEHFVGIDMLNVNSEVLHSMDPRIKDLPCFGDIEGDNKEELLKLEPDVVFAGKIHRERFAGIEEYCPVVYVDVNTIEDLNESMQLMGKVLGKDARAQELVSYYKDKMNNIEDMASQIPENEKCRVYMTSHDILKTCTAASIEDFILGVGGGINVAAEIDGSSSTVGELYPEITAEQLLNWNPDVIFINTYCSSDTKDELLTDPRFADIEAVKNKQIFQMPGYIFCWYVGVPESILGMQWTIYKLHPDQVDFTMEQEIRDFYSTFYNQNMSDSTIKDLLGE